jgi:hypothetical protein
MLSWIGGVLMKIFYFCRQMLVVNLLGVERTC